MINTFPPDSTDQPFCVRVLPRRAERRRAISNADRPNPADKNLAISSIAVPAQVTRDLLPATGFSELIGDPFGRRVRGQPKPQDLPPAMAHDQHTIEQPERDLRQ